jgi:hypothetical protein
MSAKQRRHFYGDFSSTFVTPLDLFTVKKILVIKKEEKNLKNL